MSIREFVIFDDNISDPVDNPITAMQFNLLFNSSLIEVRNIKEGFLLKQKGANTIFNSGTLNNKMGTVVNVWGLIITPGASITAQGIIAGLTLNAKEAGSSKIILTNVIISNSESQAVQTVTLNASVRAEIISGGSSLGLSSGGGGGGLPLSGEFDNIERRELRERDLLANTQAEYSFQNTDPVVEVKFKSSMREDEVPVVVEILKNMSKKIEMDPPGRSYKYFNVLVGMSGFGKKVSNGTIMYRVNNSWLNENDIDPDDIRLYKWEGKWIEKNTRIVESGHNYSLYTSFVGKFSSFVKEQSQGLDVILWGVMIIGILYIILKLKYIKI